MSDIISRIKHKLAYLQPYNLGSVSEDLYERKGITAPYPYGVYLTYTEDEIATFEAQHHIRLPEDYRRFIMEIGSEGYNPYSTMHSPLESMITPEEADDFFRRLSLAEDEIDDSELWKEIAPLIGTLGHEFPFYDTASLDEFEHPLDGYLPVVGSQGGGWYILITAGQAYGHMWYWDQNLFTPVMHLEGETFHANREPAKAALAQCTTFTQWYDIWLSRQIPIEQEHWRTSGRTVPPLVID